MDMVGRNNSNANWKARTGVALLSLGSLLMLGRLGLFAVQVPRLLASLGIDTLGVRMAVGLTALRLFQTVAFNPAAILSVACAILVLFFALVAIVAGLSLLRRRNVETAQ
jgi:hypothetical protein